MGRLGVPARQPFWQARQSKSRDGIQVANRGEEAAEGIVPQTTAQEAGRTDEIVTGEW